MSDQEKSAFGAGMAAGAVLVFLVMLLSMFALNGETQAIKREAIQKGFAEYNSRTGDWQWKSQPNVEMTQE